MATANIILLGESGVGKTALLNRLETGEFRPCSQTTEVTVHFKNIILGNEAVTITVEDTAGQERYRSLTSNYYRKAEGALLVYDVTDVASFRKLDSWLTELRNANENADVLIVGNKNEEPAKKTVNVSEVKKFARNENLEYIEASAKTGENVEEAFLRLAETILVKKGVLAAVVLYDTPRKVSLSQMPRPRSPTIEDDDIIRLKDSIKVEKGEMKKKKKKKGCC